MIPRSTAAAVVAATSIALPSAPLPTTTTAGPALESIAHLLREVAETARILA